MLPFPVASEVVVPAPSPNAHAPTSPGGVGGAASVVTSATAEYGPRLIDVSTARTR